MAKKRGREPLKPTSQRGKAIVRLLNEQGLDITNAARLAGCSFQVVFNLIHRPIAPSMTPATIEKLTKRLKLPLELVAPSSARARAS